MSSQLISIVMPVKNTELYLEACLTSICNQTETNWELIAVNDHSNDATETILAAFAQKDSRIQYFNNTGKGIIEALRLAYKHSKGNYITRMDADDIMPTHKLETLKQLLQNNGNGYVATGWVQYFADYPIGNGYQKYQDWLNKLTTSGTNYTEIYKECSIPSPCWMVSRRDFEKCEAFRPNRYPEDYDLAFRFYQYGLQVIPCQEVLHHWRDYSHRTSRTDDNYADNRFLNIKLHYFLSLEYQTDKTLVLWGAGKKGKNIAKMLVDKNITFQWICNNPNKIGKHIYDTVLQSEDRIGNISNAQIIITVAAPNEQIDIQEQLEKSSTNKAYYFC